MDKKLTVAILGCGVRGECYADAMLIFPDWYKIVALCDPDSNQIKKTHDALGLADTLDFTDVELFFEEKRADLLVIATPDRDHIPQAVRAMNLGYHLLLEKPISDSREQLQLLLDTQKRTERKVSVCHVLRYGKGYLKCAEILQSGVLGKLYAIDHSERVAYWHWAQAYVRGYCADIKLSHPSILAKCCHDLDLIQSYVGAKCKSVTSVGNLCYFKPENAPEGSADRCVDCAYVDTCAYSAKRIYVDSWIDAGKPEFQWPWNKVYPAFPLTKDGLEEGIKTSMYGACAYKCHVDMVDHQMVQMTFENGVHASLKMVFGATPPGRRMTFFCTLGELQFDERTDTIEIMPFGKEKKVINLKDIVIGGGQMGHGGGDLELIRSLYNELVGNALERTSLAESIESHLMGIAAEESRKEGGALKQVHL